MTRMSKMSGQHFKEFVETISKSLDMSKAQLARIVGVHEVQFYRYQTTGLCIMKAKVICSRLRKLCLEVSVNS